MRKLYLGNGDKQFKFADTTTEIHLNAFDDGSAATLTANAKVRIKNESGYLLGISAVINENHAVITSGQLAQLPVGNYLLELWDTVNGGTAIYPSDGFLALQINDNVTGLSGGLVSSITVDDFIQQFSSLSDQLKQQVANAVANGVKGDDGLSAYQIAVINGYKGSQTEWLASLVGAKGEKGESGNYVPETFTNLAEIQAKYPSGKNGIMVAADNGHKYIWANNVWNDAGVYQSVGIADESVTNDKLASKSVSRDKLDFQTPDFTNLFSLSNYVADEYYDLNGTLVKKGESGYSSGFGRTALIPILNGKVVYRNEKAGYNDGGSVYITFFADSAGQSLVRSQSFGLGSIPVPDGAAYFSMAVHERAKSQVIITIDQPINYIDSDFNIDFANLSRIPYTNDQARLVPRDYVSDYLTIDYVNEQVIIKKESGFALWGSNLKWIHGPANKNAETDLIYTFAEIRKMTSSEYQYLFVKRVSANTDADRDIFMFTSPDQFTDSLGVLKGSRNRIAANYVFIGFFRTNSISYSFPGTPLKVIKKQTDSLAKNISILGDSISTFSGYIPSGNAAFFPNSFITNVDQTWWKSLINKNDSLSLLLNNSWSGSRVTNTRTEEQAGYYRALHMDKDGISPDILIIYLGINDFNNNVKLGDYDNDLDTDFPTDGSTFKNAYAMMLDNATKTYPNCKIFTCTLPFSDSLKTGKVVTRNSNNDTLLDFNNVIRDISNQFGTTIIDLAQAGFNRNNAAQVLGDGVLHPNATGMQLLAKKVNFYLQETLADI